MKTQFVSLFAAMLALSGILHAQRPSTDQMAVESGVVAWVSAWNTDRSGTSESRLAPLYQPNVKTQDAESPKQSWEEYAVGLRDFAQRFLKVIAHQPADLRVQVAGDRAISSFTLHPRLTAADGREETATTQVRLVWEKTDAFWRIAEQQIDCSTLHPKPEVVAAR